MRLSRRHLLQLARSAALLGADAQPDYTLRIGKIELELAPGRTVKTTGINGTSPGPLIRVKEGQRLSIQVVNETDRADILHWHGLHIPSDVDGAVEEGTPAVDKDASRTYSFIAKPSGTRWYHSHTFAGRDLRRSTYAGEFGFFYIEPKHEPGIFDQEHFLAFREWDAYMTSGAEGDSSINVAYKYFSVNSHALGFGEPIRAKQGERLMLRMLNASATVSRRIAFAGHKFQIVALDGNAVANPASVETLALGPAERIDAIVEMNNPGVWILGAAENHDRGKGLGIVIEYANQSGEAKWLPPSTAPWNYSAFGVESSETNDFPQIPLVFKKKWAGNNWVDYWTINGKSYPKVDPIEVRENQTYRLIFDNQSDEAHPVHLHRHTFEVVQIDGTPTSGVFKDVVVVNPNSKTQVKLTANNPGLTLFHCHQQMHMDYGFMTLLKYS